MASSDKTVEDREANPRPSEGVDRFQRQPDDYGRTFRMAAPSASLNSQLSRLIHPEARKPIFGVDSTLSSACASPQRQVRIAMMGITSPRQCGIATFTTDLCDAILREYGVAQLSVVAVNDGKSSYPTLSGCNSRSAKAISHPTEPPPTS